MPLGSDYYARLNIDGLKSKCFGNGGIPFNVSGREEVGPRSYRIAKIVKVFTSLTDTIHYRKGELICEVKYYEHHEKNIYRIFPFTSSVHYIEANVITEFGIEMCFDIEKTAFVVQTQI